jgi:hypothetical protein
MLAVHLSDARIAQPQNSTPFAIFQFDSQFIFTIAKLFACHWSSKWSEFAEFKTESPAPISTCLGGNRTQGSFFLR